MLMLHLFVPTIGSDHPGNRKVEQMMLFSPNYFRIFSHIYTRRSSPRQFHR